MVPTSRILPDGVVDSVFQLDPLLRAPTALLGRHSPEAAGIDVVERGIHLEGRHQRLEYGPKRNVALLTNEWDTTFGWSCVLRRILTRRNARCTFAHHRRGL